MIGTAKTTLLADRIKKFRLYMNMSEAEFAKWAGLTGAHAKDTVHKWETARLYPSQAIIDKINEAILKAPFHSMLA